MDGRVPDYNATSCPQLTAEADISSVRLVSWGQVWKSLYPNLMNKRLLGVSSDNKIFKSSANTAKSLLLITNTSSFIRKNLLSIYFDKRSRIGYLGWYV